MAFIFAHTADWQLGKRFGAFPSEKAAVLREERLRAVERVAEAARAAGAAAVLVAGDIFDSETVGRELIAALLSRLKAQGKLAWHLLPGNHDPARPGGVWEDVCAGALPANVTVHTDCKPVELAPAVVLLPAPLTAKHVHRDPTEWMDGAEVPAGALRVGLAHGSVRGFDSAGEAAVQIDPARVQKAGLAYLALGDWHGTTKISERIWYSGTPEPDRFPDNDPGHALIVRIDGSAPPVVERVATAHFRWEQRAERIERAGGLDRLEADIDAQAGMASRRLVQLRLEGFVSLDEYAKVSDRIAGLAPRLFHLEADLAALSTFAAESDLAAMSSDALAAVAGKLRSIADGGGDEAVPAARALRKLFSLSRRAGERGAA
jgi:DNA repair exonuclease SbcCD nuclease subunit